MKRDRNHEGYYDPTAGAAIRSASRRYKGTMKCDTLMYCLGELRSFQKAVAALR